MLLRLFVSRDVEARAREHAPQAADAGTAPRDEPLPARAADLRRAWSDVAHNFRGDWQMLYKEIGIGFLLAGFIALLGDDFFNGLFLDGRAGGACRRLGRADRPGDRGR